MPLKSKFRLLNNLIRIHSDSAQDGPQEMERNQATAKHVVWHSCAWVLLSFFPYPVGHPEHEHCTLGDMSYNLQDLP